MNRNQLEGSYGRDFGGICGGNPTRIGSRGIKVEDSSKSENGKPLQLYDGDNTLVEARKEAMMP